jgi:hypothetical protein
MLYFYMFGSRSPQLSTAPPSFSVNTVSSVLKSPRNAATQSTHSYLQPNRFPLFPHPVNIAHTPTPANPFSSFTVLCTRDFSRTAFSPIALFPPCTPINPSDATFTGFPATAHSKALAPNLSSLHSTLTKKPGAPRLSRRATHYSLLTTHCPTHSATLFP